MLAPALNLGAAPQFQGIESSGGLIYSNNSRTDEGAPSPLAPHFTLAFPFRWKSVPISFVPSISFYKGWYLYHEASDTAIPAEYEHRQVTVVHSLVEAFFRFDLIPSSGDAALEEQERLVLKKRELGLNAGAAFFFPFPVAVWDDRPGEESSAILEGVFGDLYGKGKFVMPALGIYWMELLQGKHPLLISVTTYLPVHRFWDGDGLPFTDRLGLAFRVGYRWSRKESP